MWIFVVIAALAVVAAIYWLWMSPWSQVLGRFPYRVPTERRLIALTFDDGPNEPYTSQIADYLRSEGVKATFFQVGRCIERFPEVTRKLHEDGHVIGNHSMVHRFRHYFIQPRYRDELESSQDVIATHLGRRPALFRPPWLWRGPLLFGALGKKNLTPVSGEFCHVLEVMGASAPRIARGALKKARPGKIIIFHDGFNSSTAVRTHTVDALRIVVPELRRRGYDFVTVSELMGVEPYAATA